MSISTAEDFGDHSDGEGPYCAVCGCPPTHGNLVVPGRWGFVRFNMDLNMCQRCIVYFASLDPQMGDPLTLEETG